MEREYIDEIEMNHSFQVMHRESAMRGWWADPKLGPVLDEVGRLIDDNPASKYVVGTKLDLIHTEISEATEGFRTDAMDDKLSHRPQIEVELADAVIRIGDLAAALGLDVGGAINEKMAYNASRADHDPANRAKAGGKKF